jgi:hypothetical protein
MISFLGGILGSIPPSRAILLLVLQARFWGVVCIMKSRRQRKFADSVSKRAAALRPVMRYRLNIPSFLVQLGLVHLSPE